MTRLLTAREPKRGLRRFVGPKRVIAILLLGAFVTAGWLMQRSGLVDPAVLQGMIERHPLGAEAIFVLLYGLATLSVLPALPLNLAAGLFWGPLIGGILSTTAATVGAVIAFSLARLAFGQPLAERYDNRIISEIQREFAAKGWWFLAFVRINPISPTGPLNYIFGLTSINTLVYTFVTFMFLLPQAIAIAFIGQSMGTFAVSGTLSSRLTVVLAASAAVTTLALVVFGARLISHLRFGRFKNVPTAE